ncbi:hypothetical protein CVT24_003277 [Panaeolus cyanescens]|uniref:Uncharacterized protein n=1 Tax=Panaeolus cyanescens TaxID=181874 RepID=A0A409YR96_9AGAR|nr:hypothetical protein CVT24_003277 [Panaeolus cyanescens]
MALIPSKKINTCGPSSSRPIDIVSASKARQEVINVAQKSLKNAVGLTDSLRCHIIKYYVSEVLSHIKHAADLDISILEAINQSKKNPRSRKTRIDTASQDESRDLSTTSQPSSSDGFIVHISSVERPMKKSKTFVFVPASHYMKSPDTIDSRMKHTASHDQMWGAQPLAFSSTLVTDDHDSMANDGKIHSGPPTLLEDPNTNANLESTSDELYDEYMDQYLALFDD